MNAPTIGSLTDRVALQSRQSLPEGEGGHGALYVPITSLWARVRALTTRQQADRDGRGFAVSHSVVVRFRTDVQPGDRFVWRGRLLEVLGATDLDGRRTWLSCTCTETGFIG